MPSKDKKRKRRSSSPPLPEPSKRVATSPSREFGSRNISPEHAHADSIPASTHAHTYYSSLLGELISQRPLPLKADVHFADLPCSLLTDEMPPTMLALKRHTQALCLLISLLVPSDPTKWPNQPFRNPDDIPESFDFLVDLRTPYLGQEKNERHPLLETLRNANPDPSDTGSGIDFPGPSCPLKHPAAIRTTASLIAHANELLTLLDDRFALSGGLLSVVPYSDSEEFDAAKKTIFGQLIGFTRSLAERVAEYEIELIGLRHMLRGSPRPVGVRAQPEEPKTDESAARELVWPQDRYVLAGLSDDLWNAINRALSSREAERQADIAKTESVRGVGGLMEAKQVDESNLVTPWIETKSRLYRVHGCKTVFIVPAFDLDPEAPAIREVERGPLIQTMPRIRTDGDEREASGSIGRTAFERESEAERNNLRSMIEKYEEAIESLKLEVDEERKKRRIEEGKVDRLRKRLNAENWTYFDNGDDDDNDDDDGEGDDEDEGKEHNDSNEDDENGDNDDYHDGDSSGGGGGGGTGTDSRLLSLKKNRRRHLPDSNDIWNLPKNKLLLRENPLPIHQETTSPKSFTKLKMEEEEEGAEGKEDIARRSGVEFPKEKQDKKKENEKEKRASPSKGSSSSEIALSSLSSLSPPPSSHSYSMPEPNIPSDSDTCSTPSFQGHPVPGSWRHWKWMTGDHTPPGSDASSRERARELRIRQPKWKREEEDDEEEEYLLQALKAEKLVERNKDRKERKEVWDDWKREKEYWEEQKIEDKEEWMKKMNERMQRNQARMQRNAARKALKLGKSVKRAREWLENNSGQ